MPDVNASYGTPFDFIAFLGIFIKFWRPFISELFCLHQTGRNFDSIDSKFGIHSLEVTPRTLEPNFNI